MEIAWVVVVILLGTFVQGVTGFGLGLVAVPLLSLMLDVKEAVPLTGLFGWLVTFPLVHRMRRHVKWKTALLMVIGSLPGSWLGASLLRFMPGRYILIGMGTVLIASSVYALHKRGNVLRGEMPGIFPVGAGFLSGTLGASVGQPGPPAIAYTSLQPWTSDQVKGTLVCFFMLQMIGAIIGFWSKGLLSEHVLSLFAWGVPSFLLGLLGGMKAWDLLKAYRFNYHVVVNGFLVCIGSFILIRQLFFL